MCGNCAVIGMGDTQVIALLPTVGATTGFGRVDRCCCSWYNRRLLPVANRRSYSPDYRCDDLGFRITLASCSKEDLFRFWVIAVNYITIKQSN